MIYRIVTILFSANMLLGAGMYFFNHELAASMFQSLGFPVYIIYPLGIAKILGLVAIWSNKSKTLKEWAYAGFVFELMLATSAHINAQDGEFGGAVVALLLASLSYITYRKSLTSSSSEEVQNVTHTTTERVPSIS